MNSNSAKDIFVGDGEMAAMMRLYDWSRTSLGLPEQWPQSLKTILRLVLTSCQPMVVWWGDTLITFYNDAYSSFLHAKHPTALGQPASQVWSNWDQLEPRITSARRNRKGTFDEAALFILERKGYQEATYFTCSYSPIPDEGGIGGILGICTDETQRIVGERQLALLQELVTKTADARSVEEVYALTANCLATNPDDLPFAMIYRVEPDRSCAVLAGTSGIEPGHALAPPTVTFNDNWPFWKIVKSGRVGLLSDLDGQFANLPTGAWDTSPHQAVAVPIAAKSLEKAVILVVGLNPFRRFDDSYRGFIQLISAQITASLANVQTCEEACQQEDCQQTEAALRRSETQLRLIADSLPVLISYVDHQQRYRFVNQAYTNWFGLQPQEIIGKSVKDIVGDSAYQSISPDIESVLSGQFVSSEKYIFFKIAGWRYVQNNFIPDIENSEVRGYWALITDITERKQTEAALRQSEEKLHLAVIAARMVAWTWNASTDQIMRSETACDILGLTPEMLNQTGAQGWDLVHPDDLPGHQAKVTAAIANRDSYSSEFRIIRPDNGAVIWVEDRGQVRCDIQGNLLSIEGILFDITDRKQAEEALRQGEERYRYLAELIPQLVWTANGEGILLDVNQRWLDFTGLTLEQAQTLGWEAVVHPDDIPTLSQQWVAAQCSNTYYQAEGRMRRVDGAYRWHLHQAVPLKNAQGEVIKWFGTATDVEEQKQLQQQRDYLLQQEQAAREAAEAANRIKDEFLAVVSHELRSPLNPILGWSKLLQTRQLDQHKTQHALEVIERNAQMQAQLINDLLDVSRILRGKVSLDVSPVNLVATIQAAMETVRLAAEAKSIQMHTRFDPQVRYVAGDSARLQQIMWNLLSNAVKFTPNGGQVEIRLERVEADRADGKVGLSSPSSSPSPSSSLAYAQITVTDTGKGIPLDFLPYVFDHFRQESSATTRRFGGLGLGLAIVRYLVELHGGTVYANSAGEGQGATFTVKLPLIPDQPLLSETMEPLKSALTLQGIRVLVVDDDDSTREFLTFLLELHQANVIAVATADEAIATLTQFKPDVLLSDIGMPDMDGYMLIQHVRGLPPEQGGTIPAVALTAYAAEFDQQQALSAGFQKHVAKPVDPEVLIQAILSLVTSP